MCLWLGPPELVALLNLSSWCLLMVEGLFLAVPWGCLRFVIVVFPDHTHLLFFTGWLSFTQVCSYIYRLVLNFVSSPFYISICMYYKTIHR